jgi:hypothetical protein
MSGEPLSLKYNRSTPILQKPKRQVKIEVEESICQQLLNKMDSES